MSTRPAGEWPGIDLITLAKALKTLKTRWDELETADQDLVTALVEFNHAWDQAESEHGGHR